MREDLADLRGDSDVCLARIIVRAVAHNVAEPEPVATRVSFASHLDDDHSQLTRARWHEDLLSIIVPFKHLAVHLRVD